MAATYSISEGTASTVTDAACLAGLVSTRADARRVILGGGLYLNDQRVTDPKRELSTDDLLQGRFLTLRKGRRNLAFLVFNR